MNVGLGAPTGAPYAASKFAVLGLSESLAAELTPGAPRVGVSLLAPGPVRTRIGDPKRDRPVNVSALRHDPMRQAMNKMLACLLESQGLNPSDVAGQVVQAIRENRFHVVTDPEMALTGMRKRLEWMETGNPPHSPF
jgi:short-subunit dehydrogenase